MNTMICDIVFMDNNQPEMLHRQHAFFPVTNRDRYCLRVSDEIWGTRTRIYRPAYNSSFFALVLSGSARITWGDQQRSVRAGQVWAMLSDGDYRVSVSETLHILIMVGAGTALNRDCRKIAVQLPSVWEPARPALLEAVMREMLALGADDNAQTASIGLQALEFIIQLLAHAPQRQVSNRAAQTFAACSELISRQALQITSISDAAVECGIDRAYLSRLFKEHSGETAAQFLSRCKMQHAAQELARGSSVADTAAACGFQSADVFTRSFKRHYGMTPRHWCQQLD